MTIRTDGSRVARLFAALVAVAALNYGQAILMPLALAMLVAFSLAPLADRVERVGVGRAPAVVLVCLLIASVLGGIGWVVGRQATDLSAHLPEYRTIAREK